MCQNKKKEKILETLKIVLIVLAAVCGIFLLWVLAGFIAFLISFRKNSIVGKMINKKFRSQLKQEYAIDYDWWEQVDNEKITIQVGKEEQSGILLRRPTNKIAIVVHGIFGVHKDLAPQAKIFYDNNFNVFAPTLRAHDDDKSKYISMGFYEKDDLVLWIGKLIEIFGEECQIVLFGISMGAATCLLCANKNLQKNVKCIVSDSAFSSAYDELKYLIKTRGHFPSFFVLPVMNFFFKVFGKFDLKKVLPIESVKTSNLPILFFHGTNDVFVPCLMTEKMFDSLNRNDCEKVIVSGAGHIQSYKYLGANYEKKLLGFVNKWVK